MKIDIPNNIADKVAIAILIQDYKDLCESLAHYESNTKYYQAGHESDLHRYKSSLENIFEYYIGQNWKEYL